MATRVYPLTQLTEWTSSDEAIPYLSAIFPNNKDLQNSIFDVVQKIGVKEIPDVWRLLDFLKSEFEISLRSAPPEKTKAVHALISCVETYRNQVLSSLGHYWKEDAKYSYWPDPTIGTPSIYQTLPVVENYGFIDENTPIASAGSCFAYEIAFSFQRRGFNYVVTETDHDGSNGIIAMPREIDGTDKVYARFSANWGLLFNSANLRQMAERAFGLRQLPRILTRHVQLFQHVWKCDKNHPNYNLPISIWYDPFRENVRFDSIENYNKNYEIHTENCRRALMQAKVFIATLGLSEVWEFIEDSSVLSHNPNLHPALTALTRPKVLSVRENIENLQSFIKIIRQFNPEMKFIFTLSPISLAATFRYPENHVITADGYSKANLRVAIEEVVKANPDTFYFPSFEFVNRCVKNPWDLDERHVTPETVKKVMEFFDQMFVKPEAAQLFKGPRNSSMESTNCSVGGL